MLYRSLTLRLTLSFALTGIIVLLLLGSLIWYSVEQHFKEQDQAVLNSKANLLSQAFTQMPDTFDSAILNSYLSKSISGQQGSVMVFDANQQLLFSNAQYTDIPSQLKQSAYSKRLYEWKAADDIPWRGFQFHPEKNKKLSVILAVDITHHQHFMHQFWQTLTVFIVLASLAIGLLGWLIVRRSLAPLHAIRQEAEEITAHRLHTRLNMDNIPAELAELINTLNTMFARLEESFQRLSDFSSDLAHELRTPVNNLLTQTQVTLSQSRSAAEYEDILASNIEELERLSRMISDMLFLAKAENKQLIPESNKLLLAHEVTDLFEFFEILAEEKSIHLELIGEAVINGDRLMLRRAISNLLSNALRYTPEKGRVSVRLSENENKVEVIVENTGAHISKEQLNKLFDRFYRTDNARQRVSEGTGLGLAITQSIIHAHGGVISANSENGVTQFVIVFHH